MAIYFNVTKPPFDDRRVRQAFALAVNRAQVAGLARAHGRDATPATTFTPPDVLGRDLYQQVGLPSNPERARKLLAEAGYPGGAGFPQVTIVSNSAELNEAMIHEIAGMWRANLGVDVQVEFMEVWDDYLARLANDPPPLFRLGWLQDERDPHERLGSFHSAHENNHALFADPEYDQLVEDAQAAADDPPLRQALYIQAERILCEQEAAIIPLWHWLAEQ